MFSRRHPFLFSFLVFSAIAAGLSIVLTLIIVLGVRNEGFEFGEKVGIIEITGVISDSREIIEDLHRFRKDAAIKAIVLRIDSPGGVVGPSQEIFQEVKKTAKEKTVIASMGAIAASGGYYVAAAATGIVANPGTITGSIGVIIGYTNVQSLFEKIGLSPVVVKSGEFKDLASPARKMSDQERQLLQEFVDETHRQFVGAVAEGRGMDGETVARLADGRIFTGAQAHKLGLIDRLGNLEDAIEWAGEKGGIEGEIERVYAREKEFSLFKLIAGTSAESVIRRTLDARFFAGYLYQPPVK